MPTYRLHKLNEAGKYGPGTEDIEAWDDYEAMDKARVWGHAYACEVWLGRRLIGRVVAPQD
jgi:hypothetical protein